VLPRSTIYNYRGQKLGCVYKNPGFFDFVGSVARLFLVEGFGQIPIRRISLYLRTTYNTEDVCNPLGPEE
jgi:hypothetical protein